MKLSLREDAATQQRKYLQAVEAATRLSADEHVLEEPVAAVWLRMSASGLLKLRKGGKGPRHCVLGRRVCYRRSDLIGWINSQVVNPA